MKKHLITAAIVVLAVTPALARFMGKSMCLGIYFL